MLVTEVASIFKYAGLIMSKSGISYLFTSCYQQLNDIYLVQEVNSYLRMYQLDIPECMKKLRQKL
jgi:hypothetical protein